MKRAFTLIEMIVVIAILLILAAILYPVFQRPHHGGERRSSCQSNLKQISLGMLQYLQDYDGQKFPPLANARAGYWAGSLQPYTISWQIFQCPSDPTRAPKTTDYFYNARVAQVKSGALKQPAQTIALGDGTGDQLPLYHLSQLPASWRSDETSPAWRHGEGANYAFADGHVKWLRPDKITLDPQDAGRPTFFAG